MTFQVSANQSLAQSCRYLGDTTGAVVLAGWVNLYGLPVVSGLLGHR